MNNKKSLSIFGGVLGTLVIILAFLIGVSGGIDGNKSLGSVDQESGGYLSTTTLDFSVPVVGGYRLLKNGSGILGSVVITNSTAGSFNLYDATSTNHNDYATTTLAKISASVAAGTYTFDSVFSRGLVIEFQATNVASGTVTWK